MCSDLFLKYSENYLKIKDNQLTIKRPYLDFYKEMGSELVSRVVVDQEEFFRTRSALYMLLGIVPGFIKGKRVLELGPGSGHNSLHTAHLSPKEYVLVDGGEEILGVARERLSHLGTSLTEFEFVCSLFEDYEPDRQFDLVLAEACIPMQRDPATLLSQISQHVKLGGVLLSQQSRQCHIFPKYCADWDEIS